MKIVILSDTHGLLRPQVLDLLQGADAIVHGGDINSREILDSLQAYAPVYAVRGNNDKEWAEDIPKVLHFSLSGLHLCMVHNKKEIPADLSGVNVVVYGHSHKYAQEIRNGVLYLNPGSCGPRRFHQEITLARMDITDGLYTVEKILIPHEA